MINSLSMPLHIKRCTPLTASPSDKLMLSHASLVFKGFSWKLFQVHFITIITYWKHTITITHAFFTINFLISFNHPLSNLENFIFLIVSQITFCKSISFCFTIGLKNSFPRLSLCFLFLFWLSTFSYLRFLFSTYPKFTPLANTIINITTPPPCFSVWLVPLSIYKSCLWSLAKLFSKLSTCLLPTKAIPCIEA